jgi:zinc D-Ala-D-Ala dipeptidase
MKGTPTAVEKIVKRCFRVFRRGWVGFALSFAMGVLVLGAIAHSFGPAYANPVYANPAHANPAHANPAINPLSSGSAESAAPEQRIDSGNLNRTSNAKLVDIRSINSKIRLDMRYATANNFLGRRVYGQARCLLRASAAERLSAVAQDLARQGLGLKVYDCYRPLSIQKMMWQIKPDSQFVANPARGSRHNRASAVDLTLVNLKTGQELPMPSGFDEFTERAFLDYAGGTAESRRNRDILQKAMTKRGFLPLASEWWHFDDPNWEQYSLMDVPFEQIKG